MERSQGQSLEDRASSVIGNPVTFAMSFRDPGPKADRYRRMSSSRPASAVALEGPIQSSATP